MQSFAYVVLFLSILSILWFKSPHAVLCTCRPAPEAPKGVQNFAELILFACIFLYGFEILMRDLSLEIKTLIERIFL